MMLQVTEIVGEPFRFLVTSRTSPGMQYLVDLQAHGWSGECACAFWHFSVGPKLHERPRGRCAHIRAAREAWFDLVAPQVAAAFYGPDAQAAPRPD